jgi:outer membrane protein OmpA-like peptidoglycan-associated protein
LREIELQLSHQGLAVEVAESSGVLRLTENAVRFALNDWILTGTSKENVDKIASVLAHVLPGYAICPGTRPPQGCRMSSQASVETVFIEGHTDQIGADDRNWILSAQRAASTYRELTTVSPDLRRIFNHRGEEVLSISGYSSTRPLDYAQTSTAWERNRRIDLRFVMDTNTASSLEEVGALLLSMRTAIRDLQGRQR